MTFFSPSASVPHQPRRQELRHSQPPRLPSPSQLQHHPPTQRRLIRPRHPTRISLPTQCSLSLNLNTPNDKRILGIALISLPKDKNTLSSTYRLTQSEDKKAEIDLKIKITSIDSASSLKGTLQLNSEATAKFDEPKQETDTVKEGQSNQASNIKLKSKTSEDRSVGSSELKKQLPKSYKLVS